MMKKLIVVFMLSAVLLALLPQTGMAAADLSVEQTKEELTYTGDYPYADVLTIKNTSGRELTVKVQVYDEVARKYVYSEEFVMAAKESPKVIKGLVYDRMDREGQINTYHYHVTTTSGFRGNYYFAQIRRINHNTGAVYHTQIYNSYLPNNTVSSFGPQFRVVNPRYTKKWYMFTPIDLSVQGRQAFTLVASNMYEVGEVYVDVFGDTVNVSYTYYYASDEYTKMEPRKEFITFYNDFAQALNHDLDTGETRFAFGRPFSIANQLDGDTNVLMFIRNNLTYYHFPTPTAQLIRNYPNSDARKAERGGMLALMDPVEGLDLVNDHNYGN